MSMRTICVPRTFGVLSLVITQCLTSSGCVSSGAAYQNTASAALERRPATVTVENRNWSDVTVYGVFGGQRYRLGAVEKFATRSFRVPEVIPLPAELNLLAVALGNEEEYLSTSIDVWTGDAIIFTLENATQFSALFKR